MPAPSPLLAALAPQGKLRATINLGNPILVRKHPHTGQPVGISVDLAAALAERLQVAVEYVVVDAAGDAVRAVAEQRADVGFFAIDPQRGQEIAFTAPYLSIEGSYLVRDSSAIYRNEDVDQAGKVVVVGRHSAYDLFLGRELKYATLERAKTSPGVIDHFLDSRADVAAGVRQQLAADAKRVPGLRLLDGHFMVIHQAMGLAKSRGVEAERFLNRFVEEMKASGFIMLSMAKHRIEGAVLVRPVP